MPFVHPVNVRFFEVDMQGVVFNMWYLAWFDDAMTAFLTDLGFGFRRNAQPRLGRAARAHGG